MDCVRLYDSLLNVIDNTLAGESLAFLATKTLAASRDDLHEKSGLNNVPRSVMLPVTRYDHLWTYLHCSMPQFSPLAWYRRYRQSLHHFVYHDVLHADDPPHKLAMGVAVGMFVAFTPTVGVQMVIAGFLSWLLRANKAVSVALVWISNPATLVPIYWYSYRIGCAILALDPIGRDWWTQLATPPDGWWPAVTFYWSRLMQVAGPVWLGGCVVGVVCGYAMYSVTYQLIRLYRAHPMQRASKTVQDAEGS